MRWGLSSVVASNQSLGWRGLAEPQQAPGSHLGHREGPFHLFSFNSHSTSVPHCGPYRGGQSRAGTCSSSHSCNRAREPAALTRQGTRGLEGQVTLERWHRSLKVGLGQRCRELAAPGPQTHRACIGQQAPCLSGIQSGGRAVINFIGCAGLEAALGVRSGLCLPWERGVSPQRRCEGTSGGINEMPLGANNSLIGVTSQGRSPPHHAHPRAPRQPHRPPCLVRISN